MLKKSLLRLFFCNINYANLYPLFHGYKNWTDDNFDTIDNLEIGSYYVLSFGGYCEAQLNKYPITIEGAEVIEKYESYNNNYYNSGFGFCNLYIIKASSNTVTVKKNHYVAERATIVCIKLKE